MTHICVSKLTIIGSDNGLSPDRRQAIIWTNAGILLIGSLGTNFSEISIEILTFSFKKMHLKVSSAKRRPFCLGLNVLNCLITLKFDSTAAETPVKFQTYDSNWQSCSFETSQDLMTRRLIAYWNVMQMTLFEDVFLFVHHYGDVHFILKTTKVQIHVYYGVTHMTELIKLIIYNLCNLSHYTNNCVSQ